MIDGCFVDLFADGKVDFQRFVGKSLVFGQDDLPSFLLLFPWPEFCGHPEGHSGGPGLLLCSSRTSVSFISQFSTWEANPPVVNVLLFPSCFLVFLESFLSGRKVGGLVLEVLLQLDQFVLPLAILGPQLDDFLVLLLLPLPEFLSIFFHLANQLNALVFHGLDLLVAFGHGLLAGYFHFQQLRLFLQFFL